MTQEQFITDWRDLHTWKHVLLLSSIMREEASPAFWGINSSLLGTLTGLCDFGQILNLSLPYFPHLWKIILIPGLPIYCEKLCTVDCFFGKFSPTLSHFTPRKHFVFFLIEKFYPVKRETSKKIYPLSWIAISISQCSFTPNLSTHLCNSHLSLPPSLRAWFCGIWYFSNINQCYFFPWVPSLSLSWPHENN